MRNSPPSNLHLDELGSHGDSVTPRSVESLPHPTAYQQVYISSHICVCTSGGQWAYARDPLVYAMRNDGLHGMILIIRDTHISKCHHPPLP